MESNVVKEIVDAEERLKTSMVSSDTIALQDLLSDDLYLLIALVKEEWQMAGCLCTLDSYRITKK